jgi:Tol biopolymer transport system component
MRNEFKIGMAVGSLVACSTIGIGAALFAGRGSDSNLMFFECQRGVPTSISEYNFCLSDPSGIAVEAFNIHARNIRSLPSWSSNRREFVYASGDSDPNKHYLLKSDISGQTHIITKEGVQIDPQWVQNGPLKNKIVFVGRGINGNADAGVYFVDPNRNDARGFDIKQIDIGENFGNSILYTYVSPDGETLAIQTHDDLLNGNNLWIKSLKDNSAAIPALRMNMNESLLSPVFSPDGKNLAFSYYVQNGQQGTELWIRNLQNGDLVNMNVETNDYSWSPDGKQIVYSATNGLYKLDVSTKISTALTFNGSDSQMQPAWGPDGKIYYTVAAQNQSELWSINTDGKNDKFIAIIVPDISRGYAISKPLFAPSK